MRILHIAAGNLFGGIETMLLAIAASKGGKEALQSEFAVSFEGKLSDRLKALGVQAHPLGEVRVRNPISVMRSRSRLKNLMAKARYDFVACHSAWSYAVYGPAARKAGVRIVYWQHDVVTGRTLLERLASKTEPDLVICNSRFTASSVPLIFPKAKPEVIYNPVPKPMASASSREEIRKGNGVSDGEVVVFMASRMEAWKGHAALIEALGRIAAEPRWRCWIAGGAQRPAEARYQKELEDRVASHGLTERVQFLGQRDDIAELLGAADIYCQPNAMAEPFGIVFIEALHAGLPVVTTRLGGPAEVLNEKTAILTPPGDLPALVEALKSLILDRASRKAFADAGPERARSLCDPERFMSTLGKLLKETLSHV